MVGAKGSFYWKNLAVMLAAAFFPLAVVGVVYYFAGSAQIRSELGRIHDFQLRQSYDEIEGHFNRIESVMAEWSLNPLFSRELVEVDFSRRFDLSAEIIAALRVIEGSSPFIEEATFYLRSSDGGRHFSNVYGSRLVAGTPEGHRYSEILSSPESRVWRKVSDQPDQGSQPRLELAFMVPVLSESRIGFILLRIDPREIERNIGRFNIDESSVALILDRAGDVIGYSGRRDEDSDSVLDILRLEADRHRNAGGEFQFRATGSIYVANYRTFFRDDWRLFVATPVSSLMSLVEYMTRLILGTCLFVFLLTIVLSFFASGRLYRPLQALLGSLDFSGKHRRYGLPGDEITYLAERWEALSRQNVALNDAMERSKDLLKRSFLTQFLQGQLEFSSETELREEFSRRCWEPSDKRFRVLFFKIVDRTDDAADSERGRADALQGDHAVLAFAATDVLQRVFSVLSNDFAVIGLHDVSFEVLTAVDSSRDADSAAGDFSRAAEKTLDIFDAELSVKAVAVLSHPTLELSEVPRIAEDARRALRYRDPHAGPHVIDMRRVIPDAQARVHYPVALERAVSDALRMRRRSEARAALTRFLDRVGSKATTEAEIQQQTMQLLSAVLQVYYKAGLNPNLIVPGVDFFREFSELHEGASVVSWFEDRLFTPFLEKMDALRSDQEEESVREVAREIERDYAKPLSLDSCAERVGMSPYALSVKFKHVHGENFIDYLTRYRLERAKELLAKTDLSVRDVAETCGYQNNYFIRLFKKSTGVTPGEFRAFRRD